jgi:hypothetical protein
MNGAATISPFSVPNLCVCGHDYISHDLTITPNRCSLCKTVGATANTHNFQAANAITQQAVESGFPQNLAHRFVSPGGFGTRFNATTAVAGNAPGSTTVTFASAGQLAGVAPGMTFTTQPASPLQQASYRVLAVNAAVITIPAPGLLFPLTSVICIFQGAQGSTMGPALSPNGQRAG